MITAITPTGDRSLAFALCQRWMQKQTVQADQWIVVDDGKVPMIPEGYMEYVRREPQPGDPRHTLAINLKMALPLILGDKILIIEDDEYYAPDYIATMSMYLDKYEVVGIMRSKYYHIPSGGYVQIGNMGHASLAETGFKKSFVPDFEKFIERGINTAWLDTQIWRTLRIVRRRQYSRMITPRSMRNLKNQMPKSEKVLSDSRAFLFIDADKPLYLGIKGLPGRHGIGQGHNIKMYHARDNETRDILKRWIPKDYQVYLDVLNGKLNENNYREYFDWQ